MVEYWVWLQQVLGYGSSTIQSVLREYKSAYNFYQAPFTEKVKKIKLTKSQVERLNKIPRKTVYGILKECKDSGITIITPESTLYPTRLLGIPNPPSVLYAKGNLFNLDDELVIAMVGPRKPSEYGVNKTFEFSKTLSRGGCVILSGGALGIDTAAHTGALSENGKTVLVLGHGINFDYLKENKNLRREILKDGFIVTEYPPSHKASRSTFPQRNRIMSGLSVGVAVMEAPEKSGALITANLAAEQGKDVFVMPGSPDNKCYIGSNKLLRDGAITLLEPLNIFEEYLDIYPHKINLHAAYNIVDNTSFEDYISSYEILADTPFVDVSEYEKPEKNKLSAKKKKEADVSKLSKEAQLIYDFVENEFFSDEIVTNLNLDIKTVLAALTELEIFGIVAAIPGGRYKLVR